MKLTLLGLFPDDITLINNQNIIRMLDNWYWYFEDETVGLFKTQMGTIL